MTRTPGNNNTGAAETKPRQAAPFSAEQEAFLAQFFAELQQSFPAPQLSATEAANDPPSQVSNEEPELTKQELWKREEEPLDIWEKLVRYAQKNEFPGDADAFRFRYHGLFYVAPVQNSLMLRCRISGGEITAAQFEGLAEIAERWGNGYADLTTRSNVQMREIAPKNMIHVLSRLNELGLTSRGTGVDNLRNFTASPSAGLDRQELIDTRPIIRDLHQAVLNRRDLYGLPRKFNIAVDGGGSINVLAETNDLGFFAVELPLDQQPAFALAFDSNEKVLLNEKIYFRVQLAGISGHKKLACDAGILIPADRVTTVALAMVKVFSEHGCRTDRKKARLKYLLDDWGTEKFLTEVQKKLPDFSLLRFPEAMCRPPSPALTHGHVGVYRQRQRGLNYLGVVVPVGRLTVRQMRRLAELARNYGSSELRLTPWQNLLIPNIPDAYVETVKRAVVGAGLGWQASSLSGGLVACTGNQGCKYASTNTKGHALQLAKYLEGKVNLDQPINIHFTGCPNSCAQHYIGDIGLIGTKATLSGESVEAYHVVLGGGVGVHKGIGQEVFRGIPFSQLPKLLEHVLEVFLQLRQTGESFAHFVRRHSLRELQELFS